jgi:hypothetical protein
LCAIFDQAPQRRTQARVIIRVHEYRGVLPEFPQTRDVSQHQRATCVRSLEH